MIKLAALNEQNHKMHKAVLKQRMAADKGRRVFIKYSVMGKDFLIRKGQIRADEHTERIMISKSALGVGKQNDRLVNPIERPFIAMNPILVNATVTRWYWPFGSMAAYSRALR